MNPAPESEAFLPLCGIGGTGRRITQRLQDCGLAVHIASDAGTPVFDRNDLTLWEAA